MLGLDWGSTSALAARCRPMAGARRGFAEKHYTVRRLTVGRAGNTRAGAVGARGILVRDSPRNGPPYTVQHRVNSVGARDV